MPQNLCLFFPFLIEISSHTFKSRQIQLNILKHEQCHKVQIQDFFLFLIWFKNVVGSSTADALKIPKSRLNILKADNTTMNTKIKAKLHITAYKHHFCCVFGFKRFILHMNVPIIQPRKQTPLPIYLIDAFFSPALSMTASTCFPDPFRRSISACSVLGGRVCENFWMWVGVCVCIGLYEVGRAA